MPKIDEYLRLLGLSREVTATVLKKAYRRKIFECHPDRFGNQPDRVVTATAQAVQVNAAYEYLSELLEQGPLPQPRESSTPNYNSRESYRTQHTYNRAPFSPGFPSPGVFEVFVKSSHIISTGYDRGTGTMYIKFEGDRVYAYHKVPESVFADFIAAESHGKFAHQHIYGRYDYTGY